MQNIRDDYIQQILAFTETSQKPSDTSKLLILDSGDNVQTLFDDGIVIIQNGSRNQQYCFISFSGNRRDELHHAG